MPHRRIWSSALVAVSLLATTSVAQQPQYIALISKTEATVPYPVDGIVTVPLASGVSLQVRALDIDYERTAAYTNRVIIRANTATVSVDKRSGRKYLNLTFDTHLSTRVWVDDVDFEEVRNGFPVDVAWKQASRELREYGPSFQFDTKGVDFGSWLKKFRTQVYSKWMIPYAAMALHGHTVMRFTIHRDGVLSDVVILQPSGIDAFNKAAFNALKASDPTVPLPSEYPDDQMVMTVIFYYNEKPPGGGAIS